MRNLNSKKILISVIFVLIFSFAASIVVKAQTFDIGGTGSGNEQAIDLNPIVIPLFNSGMFDFVSDASIFSWFAFLGGLLTIGMVAYWIVRILVSGVEALRSEGDQEKLQQSYAKLRANFIGMFLTFMFPAILSIIGFILGIGSIFNWPKMFTQCDYTEVRDEETVRYQFYFQAFLGPGDGSIEKTDAICGSHN